MNTLTIMVTINLLTNVSFEENVIAVAICFFR